MPGLAMTGAGFGAFGKMPALGDFFRFGLPPDFVSAWDAWIQSGMLSARTALGEHWTNAYLTAPIWRFTLAPGAAGAAPVLGVLMPSVDRVGRQFPLCLAAVMPQPVSPATLHLSSDTCFDALERVALDALDDTMTRAALEERLSDLAVPAAPGPAHLEQAPGFLALAAPPGAALPAAVAGRILDARRARPCVWSALLATGNRLLATDGLPDPSLAGRFYAPDGDPAGAMGGAAS